MDKSEDEKMKAYILRDSTFWGSIGHRLADTARGAINKPPYWYKVREWEIRREAAKALAKAERLEVKADRAGAKGGHDRTVPGGLQKLMVEMTRSSDRSPLPRPANDRARDPSHDAGR